MAVVIGKGSFRGFGESRGHDGFEVPEHPDEKLISGKLQQIAYNVTQLVRLKDNMDTPADTVQTRKATTEIITSTNQLVKQTNEIIKQFCDNEPADLESHPKWKLQVKLLKENFHEELTKYRDIQSQIKKIQRTVIRNSLNKSGCFNIDVDESGRFTQDGEQIQIEAIQADVDLDLIKEREQAIKQLEQDILDVNEIFRDLAVMVEEQADMIVEVEENIIEVKEHVETVVEELEETNDTVQKIRQNRILIGGIVAVVVCVIVLIIVLTQVT